jgi:hypothetical protein
METSVQETHALRTDRIHYYLPDKLINQQTKWVKKSVEQRN